MQTWLWGERYPDFMDALIPVACMPVQIAGRNLIWRQIIICAIRNDPDWHEGNYDLQHPPTLWTQTAAPLLTMMALNPEKLQQLGPDRNRTLAFYEQLVAQYHGRDASDYLYDLESSADYDPAPSLVEIKAPLLAINFADNELNPPQFILCSRLLLACHPPDQRSCRGETLATDTTAHSTRKCGQRRRRSF
jgi:homoserine O-acetyltransferase